MKTLLATITLLGLFLLTSCSPKDTRDPLLILAEEGDPQAQYEWVARLKSESPEDTEEIYRWYAKAVQSGHLDSRIEFSNMLIEGYFGEDRIPEGVAILEGLAEDNNAVGQSQYARLLEEGTLVAADAERAAQLYQLASEQNEPYALYRVAKKEFEEKGESLNRSQEMRLETMLSQAGKGGISEAYYLLGTRSEAADDLKTAEKWYFEAAKLGHPQGMYRTGVAYQRLGPHPTYGPLGFDYLSKALDAGAVDAFYPLGLAYRKGYGTDMDEEKGKQLNLVAASLKMQKAIDPIILEIYQKKNWDYEDHIEAAAWMNWSPSLEQKVKLAISDRIIYSDDVFFKQLSYRTSQIQLIGKSYLAERFDSYPKLTEEEERILNEPYSSRYGSLEALFLAARSDLSGGAQLELGQALLDAESPHHDKTEALHWIRSAIAMNNASAGIIGYNLFNEGKLDIDQAEAERFLKSSSDLGNPEAMFLHAKTLLNASDPDHYLVVKLLLDTQEKGNAESGELLRKLISEEKGINLNDTRIRVVMETLASEGNARMDYLLAIQDLRNLEASKSISSRPPVERVVSEIIVANRKGQVNRNSPTFKLITKTREETNPSSLDPELSQASQRMIRLAEQGNFDARFQVSVWKYFGFYTEQNIEEATSLWRDLYSEKPTDDLKLLRSACLYHGYFEESDLFTATTLAREVAESGNEYAQKYFSDLDDSTEQYSTVFDTIYRATVVKDPLAMKNLGNHYNKDSRFTLEEKNQGYLKWLGEAAKHGDAEAMAAIGIAFLEGKGVEKNVTRGIRYLEEGAKLGLAEAQYTAGFAYAMGEHIPKDVTKAVKYLTMASENGYVAAANLLSSIQSISALSETDIEDDNAIRNAVLSSALNQDYFPIKPYAVYDGELRLITDSRSKRGVFSVDGKAKSADKKTPYVFLADEEYSDARIEISKQIAYAPIIMTENGIIFTGNEPSVAFEYQSNVALSNCICLLVVRDSDKKFNYNWRRIGKVSPDRKYKTKFGLDDAFFDLEDLAIYFFDNGKEVLSDGRRQLQYFIQPELEKFTFTRNTKTKDLKEGTFGPTLYKSIDTYLYGFVGSNAGTTIEMQVSKLGFIKDIQIRNAKDNDTRSKLLYQLSKVTLLPRVIDGELASSRITMTL